MTIKDLRSKYYKKIDFFDFDILVALVLDKTRVFVLSHPEYKLNTLEYNKIERLFKRRTNNEPLAYIIGRKEFFSNEFIVNKNVLIPRPETEIMVELALEKIKQSKEKKIIIDTGTGSGCIIISLAKKLKNSKNIDFYGLDISPKALMVARKNAKLNKIDNKINFLKSDLLLNMKESKIKNQKSKIIITANLPYLTSAQIKNSPTIKKEPRLALLAGVDGLKYYRKLFKQISIIKKSNPSQNFTIFCEIDPSQKKNLEDLTKNIFDNDSSFEIKKDLRNLNRFAIITL